MVTKMSDFRENVEADRGLIKKIQLAVPGFRGYRQKEDIRISDSMLRIEIANLINSKVISTLEEARLSAAKALEMDVMNDFANTITEAKTIEAKVRHAVQGYSGISAAVNVGTDELNKLYEYDSAIVDTIEEIGKVSGDVLSSTESGNYASVQIDLRKVNFGLKSLKDEFEKRSNILIKLG